MPVYQYRNLRTGRIEELVRSVAQRDAVPPGLVRIPVPERIGIAGTSSTPIDPRCADAEVPRAFRQLEEKSSAREIAREGGYTVDQVKQIWSM